MPLGISVGASTAIIAGCVGDAQWSTQFRISVVACCRSKSNRCRHPSNHSRQHKPLAPEVQPKSIPKNFIASCSCDFTHFLMGLGFKCLADVVVHVINSDWLQDSRLL